MKILIDWIKNKRSLLILILLFVCLVFLRFSFLEQRLQFSWDEVNNAWAAKDILLDHKILLLGMPAKLNSGFSIGPLYYYFVALFYWVFRMDPIAAGYIAGVTSIITFAVLFWIAKRIFSLPVAFFVVFLYTFSFPIGTYDRFQWPVNFITAFSALIFYFLYKVITGNPKYFIGLAVCLGLSFHIHFTSIFYPIIIAFSLPFIPWNKKTLYYFLLSIPLLLIWFIPQIAYEIQHKGAEIHNLFSYNHQYNHGLHVRRMIQIAPDIFFEFMLLTSPLPGIAGYSILPIFLIVYFWKKFSWEKLKFAYILFLWILVPWIIFALYTGELTDYYFSVIRPIALFTSGYLLYRLFSLRFVATKAIGVILILAFVYTNTTLFFTSQYQGVWYHRQKVFDALKKGEVIQFTEGVPESYIYYIYTHGYGIK